MAFSVFSDIFLSNFDHLIADINSFNFFEKGKIFHEDFPCPHGYIQIFFSIGKAVNWVCE